MPLSKHIKQGLILCSMIFFLFFCSFINLSADEIDWIEVANTENEIQFIDSNSIKYDNRGYLSVIIKYSKINLEDQQLIKTNSYLMAVDCENRLFSKLPVNGELKQVKNWEKPINNKLMKKTKINSCSY